MAKPTRKSSLRTIQVASQDEISNGTGAWGSGGSMSNPMYKHVHTVGCYTPYSGRKKKRFQEKSRGVCVSKKWKFWELGMVGNKGVK